MHQDNPPPYTPGMAQPPPPGMSQPPPPGMMVPPPPPGVKPFHSQQQYMDPQATTHHVIISPGPTIMNFGPTPQHMVCPSCHAEISTTVKVEPNTKTHLFALILCLFQCYCCCCIPYCVDSCQSQNHYCPNCQAYLGGYQN